MPSRKMASITVLMSVLTDIPTAQDAPTLAAAVMDEAIEVLIGLLHR